MKIYYPLYIAIFVLVGMISCNDCAQYTNEIYSNDSTVIETKVLKNLDTLFQQLDAPSYNLSNKEYYRVIYKINPSNRSHYKYYDSYGNIETAEFEFKSVSPITLKIIKRESSHLNFTKWKKLKRISAASKFWNLPVTSGSNVLDPAIFYIEANRPKAKKCGKKDFHAILHSSPEDSLIQNFIIELMDLKKE